MCDLKVAQVDYGEQCVTTVQCKTSLKLVCSTSNDQSYGPTSLSVNRCDCLVSQYYQDSTTGCGNPLAYLYCLCISLYSHMMVSLSIVTRKSINQACSWTYQCVVNVNLICLGGICVCNYGYYNNAGTCGG